MHHDPYLLTAEKIKEPPKSFREKLLYLGPGFVLSASIVGSGELIATTTLGAEAQGDAQEDGWGEPPSDR